MQSFPRWTRAIALAMTMPLACIPLWAGPISASDSTPPLPPGAPTTPTSVSPIRPGPLNTKIQTPFERRLAPQLKKMWENSSPDEREVPATSHTALRQFDATGAANASNPNFPSFVVAPFLTLNPSQDASGASVAVTGDFNNDGKPDVVIIQSGGTVTTILNPGSFQNFATVPQLPPNTSFNRPLPEILEAYAVDLHKNGNLDIVAMDAGNHNIVVWPGNGDGTFGDAVLYSVKPTSGANFVFGGSILIADFNHDGNLDVAAITSIASYYPKFSTAISIQTFLNDGTGKLIQPTTETDATFNDVYEEGAGEAAVVSNDGTSVSGIAFLVNNIGLNNHGAAGSNVLYVSNNGDGTFTAPVEPAGPAIITPAGSQTAFSANASLYATSLSSKAGATGEPTTDIVFVTGDGAVYDAPYRPGSGSFTLPAPSILIGANVYVPQSVATASTTGIGSIPIANAHMLNLADMNKDGLVDLVVYTAGSALIFPNQGDNTFGAPVQVVAGLGGSQQAQPADFEGTGYNSFFSINSYLSNDISYYRNLANGQFYAAPSVAGTSYNGAGYDALGTNIQVQAAGDFNGDGLLDVIAYDLTNVSANSGFPDLVVGLNNGQKNSSNQVDNFTFIPILPAATLMNLNVAYVQHFTVPGSKGTSFLLATGTGGLYTVTAAPDGSFGAPTALDLGTTINCELSYGDSGDVNGDGVADIVVAYGGDALCNGGGSTPSGFFTFLGNGDGTFGTATFTPLGNALYMAKLINFNGKAGNADVAAIDYDPADGFFTVYTVPNTADNTGGFDTEFVSQQATGYIVSDIIPGDFNHDGKQDLTLTTLGQYVPESFATTPNTMGVLLLPFLGSQTFQFGGSAHQGFYKFGTPTLINTGFYSVSGVYADFNGDGYPDLAVTTVDTQFHREHPFSHPPAVPLVQIFPNQGGYFGPVLTEVDFSNYFGDPFPTNLFTGNFGNTGGNDLMVAGAFNTAEFLNQGANTLTLGVSSSSPAQGSPVTLTATITQSVSGNVPTAGSVSFSANGQLLGAVAISGNTAALTTTDLPVGTDTVTATYSGDANHDASSASTTVTVAASAPAFVLSSGSSSLSLQPGATGSLTLQVASNGTFSGAISFTCSGAPTEATCTVNPSSVTLGGNQSSAVTVVIATTAPNNTFQASSQSPWLKAAGGVSMALLFLVIPRRRRFLQMAAVLVLSVSGLAMLSGCGKSGPTFAGTPAGQSNLTITATSGSITQTQTIALTIASAQAQK